MEEKKAKWKKAKESTETKAKGKEDEKDTMPFGKWLDKPGLCFCTVCFFSI